MKLKKITALLLITVLCISSVSLTATLAEEQTEVRVIPEDIPAEKLTVDKEYSLYNAIIPFSDRVYYADAPFTGFDVSKDGGTVALLFATESETAVSIFKLTENTLEFSHGFDIRLPETATARIWGEYVLIWLKRSGVIFAVDDNINVVEIRRLADGGDGSAVSAAETLFGDGIGEKRTESGSVFLPSEPFRSDAGAAYAKLLLTDSEGIETVLYDASAIPRAGAPVAAIIGGATALLTIAAIITETVYAVKKKSGNTDGGDPNESAPETENGGDGSP